MTRKKGLQSKGRVLDLIQIGGKLMLYWSVFLILLEIVTYFGATKVTAKALDLVALAVSFLLMLLSTLGVGMVTRILSGERLQKREISRSARREAARG